MIVEKESRVEALRERLLYPLKKRDPQGSDFWYLHPGESEADAEETAPISVGFFSELNDLTDEREIQRLLTSKEWQQKIYGHYLNRSVENKPVVYLLLPTEDGAGRVPLVLPTEGGLRQRNIQTFAWGSAELETRLNRLRQGELPIATKALISIPLVERAFYQPIKTAKDLAHLLAEAARRIEQIIPKVYKSEEHRYPASQGNEGYLHKLLKSFQDELLPSLRLASENEKDYSFSDIYAQTIAYSLFTARVFSYVQDQRQGNPKETLFDRESAWQQLPETNPFLRRLFQDVSERSSDELGDELIGAIAEIFTILRAAKMDVILQDFREKQNRKDIVIHFYESFLDAYKQEMRERRGVYYTPESIVSYMVKSVDYILRKDFSLADGLADASKIQYGQANSKESRETHKVLITDVAAGTGTFLHGVIDHIYRSFDHNSADWSDYVAKDLLPRLLGFELLMAPYAVAHMKLGLQLLESGYKFNTPERLRVFLTNTLQEAFQIPSADGYDSWFRDEANAANAVKEKAPVMVILGNPPYSGVSENTGNWIHELLRGKDILNHQPTQSYFEVDGKPLNERKHWLNDDYVKFIRFGQWRIEQTGYGVLAFITNHGYLDNPTFRGMRQSLMETFDDIYVLDLHGNVKKKESSPDGTKDANVFNIQQGVAIGVFVKRLNGNKTPATIHHSDVWGSQEAKYRWLEDNDVETTHWETLAPQSPFYLFVPQDTQYLTEYEQGWKLTDIFPVNSTGIVTARDHFVLDFDRDSLLQRIQEFANPTLSDVATREKYFWGKGSSKYPDGDTRGWKLPEARRKVQSDPDWEKRVVSCSYRPFDYRKLYYTEWMVDWSRGEVMGHMLAGENLAFHVCRQTVSESWQHILATNQLTDDCYVSNKSRERGYTIPLHLYPEAESEKALGITRRPNLCQPFLNDITAKLGYTPTPEAIFYYIYAIFHSPTYRSRYAEFLKIDFPRVPLTRNDTLFRQLAAYGEQLVALHLMKSASLAQNQLPQFVEQGGNCIVDPAHPKYEINTLSVIINKKGDRFTDIPQAVWNFYVGGYPVCAKWLKDRKGRTLSPQDITHYQQIVVALSETIKLMTAIDQAIPGFPIE
ncbi:type ISP restriction/modification enzyme [Phormidesmis priestleyi]|uniref:type ISP restriction/modification enzyme n=1 Tax=Phormidesmis priestleyi TaxID=268141 RepID=UPI001E3D9F6D|nr:type ISP restriction/modification enzyme [Phormidesmis priestleyi]